MVTKEAIDLAVCALQRLRKALEDEDASASNDAQEDLLTAVGQLQADVDGLVERYLRDVELGEEDLDSGSSIRA